MLDPRSSTAQPTVLVADLGGPVADRPGPLVDRRSPQWTRCEENLDQARSLDPGGEADPSGARLRDAVRVATRPR